MGRNGGVFHEFTCARLGKEEEETDHVYMHGTLMAVGNFSGGRFLLAHGNPPSVAVGNAGRVAVDVIGSARIVPLGSSFS